MTGVAGYRMHWTSDIKVDVASGATVFNWTDQQNVPLSSTNAIINLPDTTERAFMITSVEADTTKESLGSNIVGYPNPVP